MQYSLKELLPNKFIEMSCGHSISHQTTLHSLIYLGWYLSLDHSQLCERK